MGTGVGWGGGGGRAGERDEGVCGGQFAVRVTVMACSLKGNVAKRSEFVYTRE